MTKQAGPGQPVKITDFLNKLQAHENVRSARIEVLTTWSVNVGGDARPATKGVTLTIQADPDYVSNVANDHAAELDIDGDEIVGVRVNDFAPYWAYVAVESTGLLKRS